MRRNPPGSRGAVAGSVDDVGQLGAPVTAQGDQNPLIVLLDEGERVIERECHHVKVMETWPRLSRRDPALLGWGE
jgi:hypothetical protein